jgi:hypothetical protein
MTTKRNTPEIIPPERIFTIVDLRTLAERGAAEAGKTSQGYGIYVTTQMLDSGREFSVSINGPTATDLLIEVEFSFQDEQTRGTVTRKLTKRAAQDSPTIEQLPSLELTSDASGNPVALVNGRVLSEYELVEALVGPVKKEAGL